jgi:hypothetical protein
MQGDGKKIFLKAVAFSAYRTCFEAGILKNYCPTNSGSPEVELRFCPLAHIVQILNCMA